MGTLVIVGAQWGDEGKGKVVDLLSDRFDVVVRYAGGPNAGHTLVVGDDKLVFRLVPSGILRPHVSCVLGHGMVINPGSLLEEIDQLIERDISVQDRLWISDRAHLILPYHIALDGLRERALGAQKIGTTKRGIGPCYEDKVGRRGVRSGDLFDLSLTRKRVTQALTGWAPVFASLGASPPSSDDVMAGLTAHRQRLLPLIRDTAAFLDQRARDNNRILLEGAQGTLLDLDHGTYPFVTSSSAVAGGACTGGGIGPSHIDAVLGITKAYTTRVGSGPFPTEVHDHHGEHLCRVGHEFGSVTGRPRRAGWLDLAALRYARIVNGLTHLAVTKLDVLSGLPEVYSAVGYHLDGEVVPLPPRNLAGVRPQLQAHPGWTEDISGCRTLAQLPKNARTFLDHIQQFSQLPIAIVSVGPRRDQTIMVTDIL